VGDGGGRHAAKRRIGVVCSARISAPDKRYSDALATGFSLASAGYEVVTGGYGGLMAAVSRGAAEAGGHVVGLPMRGWVGLTPNQWVTELIWAEDFFDRLRELGKCDAIVALAGGVGTLAETAVTWANLQTDPSSTPRLILVGPGWARLMARFRRELVVDDRDLGLVRLVPSRHGILGSLEAGFNEPDTSARPLG
jgi:uncharacterized protein (TIGR00730 family)